MVFPSRILEDGPYRIPLSFELLLVGTKPICIRAGSPGGSETGVASRHWPLLQRFGLSLSVTFWIGETLMGIVGALVYFPLTAVLLNASWQGLSWSGVNEP